MDLARQDAVANVFILSHLEAAGSAAPTAGGASILGVFDGGILLGACWAGANLVPVQLDPELAGAVALGRAPLRAAGTPRSSVRPTRSWPCTPGWNSSARRPMRSASDQPLMTISGPPAVAPNPQLGFGQLADFDKILPACAAMFEEEVGYSPYLGGREYYSRRVKGLIREGHSLVHLDAAGEVVFKAELGAVTPEVTQVQGVWMNPALRGQGLSAGYMAAVVVLAQTRAPVTSLYVNNFNSRARATYERVGFRQVGTFATVLFLTRYSARSRQ